jgi:hypothetical protein
MRSLASKAPKVKKEQAVWPFAAGFLADDPSKAQLTCIRTSGSEEKMV